MGDSDYEVTYTTKRRGVTIERRRYGRFRYTSEYVVSVSPEYYNEEVEFIRQGWHQARCLAIILNRDYWHVATAEEGMIPEKFAIEGKPAVATYLCGVHQYSTKDVADMMDVKRETVVKYISRFDPQRTSE